MKERSVDEMLAMHRWAYYVPPSAFIEGRGFRVSIIVEGHDGHWPTGDLNFGKRGHVEPWFWGMTYNDAEQEAAEQNAKLGLSEKDIVDIFYSAIRGGKRG